MNNTQLLAGANRDVMLKNNSVQKIVNDKLSKKLVRALPYVTVWVDESSPFVVLGVANICLKTRDVTRFAA